MPPQLDYDRITVAMAWVSAVSAAGIAANVKSLSGWTLLAGLAVLPPLVMRWRPAGLPQTVRARRQVRR